VRHHVDRGKLGTRFLNEPLTCCRFLERVCRVQGIVVEGFDGVFIGVPIGITCGWKLASAKRSVG